MTKIAVSILSKNDPETIKKINDTNADYLHIDVMDGTFVKQSNFPISKIEEISYISNKLLDVHLMVNNPSEYIKQLPTSKTNSITVHYEILNNNFSIIDEIKARGFKCGLSINPETDVKKLFGLLEQIDLILIMSVEPGLSGQTFMTSSLTKVKMLKEEIIKVNSNVKIAIDGGINNTNAKDCINSGCDILVVGTYIVDNDNYQQAIEQLK